MKNWSASSLLALATFGWASAVHAASLEQGLACLEASDIVCAQRVAADLPGDDFLDARIAFNLGHFEKALDLAEATAESFPGPREAYERELALYRATVEATAGFLTERRGDVEIRYLPGTDAVLIDEAFETLQASHDRIGPLLGGAPPGGVRMEIYPTGARFTAASGLPPTAVQTTGVVALSKWTRLLVSSPRALGRGYAWKDTIAHEYIHYVVAWRTKDRTPVWLQEGIARSHEGLWRADEPAALQPLQQSLLATALARDSLVPLERMHPSMAFLDSAEEASLAFAQVSSMVVHLRETAGPAAVSRALDRVRDGADALDAVAAEGAGGDTAAFMEGWKQYLRSLSLVSRKLAALPTVLGASEDDFGVDPVLARRQDLAGHARIGDLLREAKRPDAALVEYERARTEDEPPSPTLSARMALAMLDLGRTDEAVATLQASVSDYPEFALTRKSLGKILLSRGQLREALAEYRAAADVNPFDPEVQGVLADLYGSLGDAALAARHARYRRILDLGGEDPEHGERG